MFLSLPLPSLFSPSSSLLSQVKVTSKPNHPGITTGMGLPDIQNLVNKAVSLIRERESDIEVLRQNADKISFGMCGERWRRRGEENRVGEGEIGRQARCTYSNSFCIADVKWGVELGNCEVLLEKEEQNGTVTVVKYVTPPSHHLSFLLLLSLFSPSFFSPCVEYKVTKVLHRPYGTVRLSDAQRQQLTKSYFEVENQLVLVPLFLPARPPFLSLLPSSLPPFVMLNKCPQAKTGLALQENAKEEYELKINKLQSTVSHIPVHTHHPPPTTTHHPPRTTHYAPLTVTTHHPCITLIGFD